MTESGAWARTPISDHGASLTRLVRRLQRTHPRVWDHSIRVGAIMALLSRQPGASLDRQAAILSGLLHDVGKITVPPGLLGKARTLTVRERALLEQHARAGAELLGAFPETPEAVVDAALCHHERMDGSGYPDGLAGNDIPEIARLCAVADTLDAMTGTDRPYRLPRTPAEAVAEIVRGNVSLFDPAIVEALRSTRLSELDRLRNVDQARKAVQDVLTDLELGGASL